MFYKDNKDNNDNKEPSFVESSDIIKKLSAPITKGSTERTLGKILFGKDLCQYDAFLK